MLTASTPDICVWAIASPSVELSSLGHLKSRKLWHALLAMLSTLLLVSPVMKLSGCAFS